MFLTGRDYAHQQLNPSNQCQWCDLNDATARLKSAWSNRPEDRCDDGNKCTKQDTCKAGRYGPLYTNLHVLIGENSLYTV